MFCDHLSHGPYFTLVRNEFLFEAFTIGTDATIFSLVISFTPFSFIFTLCEWGFCGVFVCCVAGHPVLKPCPQDHIWTSGSPNTYSVSPTIFSKPFTMNPRLRSWSIIASACEIKIFLAIKKTSLQQKAPILRTACTRCRKVIDLGRVCPGRRVQCRKGSKIGHFAIRCHTQVHRCEASLQASASSVKLKARS